jgi:membrane-bound serine protease (ClpP class)
MKISRMPIQIFLLSMFAILFFPELYSETQTLQLTGHLGKEEVAKAEKLIQETSSQNVKQLIIELNSTSGDIKEVLKLAKSIYSLRSGKKTEIIVYIEDSAVGPSAMIPFVADKLYISLFVSWGDIPLGSEDVIPSNVLRNMVKSLIPSENPKFETLSLIAAAMSDPKLVIINDGGWKLGKVNGKEVIKQEGENLVMNHQQLQKLGLVTGMMSVEEFKKQIEKRKEPTTAVVPQIEQSSVDKKLSQFIKINKEGPNQIGLIRIMEKNSQISQATWIYVKSALDYYKKSKPAFIILELNTPGGEVFSAQKISDALKEMDTQYEIPVVTFINNWAISAGAMLAYSTRFISVTKDASMGAAEPVQQGEGGQMVAASEKVNSALRADFANRAGFFDRNPAIAEAMVDKDLILVERYGKVIKFDKEDQIKKTDIIISPKGKLLTLNAEQMMKYGVADIFLRPEKIGLVSEMELEKGRWAASKMLVFQYSFFKNIPGASIDYYRMDIKTQFLSLISNPIVSSLLFLGLMLGFYVEINTPGFGVPGSLALICLVLIILSSFALEIANVLELLLLLVGVAFVAIDLFVIPTFGLLGIVGAVFFFMGLFGMMLPGIGSVDFEFDTKTFNAAGEVFIQKLALLCGTLLLGVLIMVLMGRYLLPSFKGFNRFVLTGHEQTVEDGYFAGADPKTLPKPGTRGEVLATLRPSGKVLINDAIYDAITSGGFIEKGSPIVVERLDGGIIIVNEDLSKE